MLKVPAAVKKEPDHGERRQREQREDCPAYHRSNVREGGHQDPGEAGENPGARREASHRA
jgi:hypothetical protein